MDKITRMREHILCTVIDHGVALCKQVVIQRRVHDKIVLKVRLKLIITRIHDPVLYTNPRIFRSLHFLFGASLVDVAELKAVVTVPSFLREIAAQESGLLIGIVIDLNDNLFMVIRVHTHRIAVFLRVANITAGIEMPLTVMEHGAVLNIRLLHKNNTRVEGHRVAHLRVILACLSNVRVKLIEIICQQRVVCIFRRCNVDFDIKVILSNAVFRQRIHRAGAFIAKGKAALTVNVDVTRRFTIVVRACALSLVGTIGCPVVLNSASVLVDLLDNSVCNFVFLTGSKGRRTDLDNTQVGAALRQNVRVQLTACIRDVVAVVPLDHLVSVLGVCNKVVQDLIVGQVHHIALHAID